MAKRTKVQELLDVQARIDKLTVRQVTISEQIKVARERLEELKDSGVTREQVEVEVNRLSEKKNAAENLLAQVQ